MKWFRARNGTPKKGISPRTKRILKIGGLAVATSFLFQNHAQKPVRIQPKPEIIRIQSQRAINYKRVLTMQPAEIIQTFNARTEKQKQTLPLSLLIATAQNEGVPAEIAKRFANRIPRELMNTRTGRIALLTELYRVAQRKVESRKWTYWNEGRFVGRGRIGFEQLGPLDRQRLLTFHLLYGKLPVEEEGMVAVGQAGVDERVNAIINRSAVLEGDNEAIQRILEGR